MDSPHNYAVEDWLVHSHYGIGQIKDIEIKGISGVEVHYFRIETSNSTYWIPVDQMESNKIRPISTIDDIEVVIRILQRPPREMSSDHKIRKTRMNKVQLQNLPEDTARLIRDMRARQHSSGKYNLDENVFLRTLTEKLVEEWAIVMGTNPDRVVTRLNTLLGNPQMPDL